jgi:ribosomal-protein-alanine N-acetyltransferase
MDIERRAFAVDAFSEMEFRDLVRRGKGLFLVARSDDRVVGYVCALMFGGEGYIASIAVAPDCQGQGIGSALMSAIEPRIHDRGGRVITLHVRTTNTAALALYKKRGYAILSVVPHYYGDGASGYYMRLMLLK